MDNTLRNAICRVNQEKQIDEALLELLLDDKWIIEVLNTIAIHANGSNEDPQSLTLRFRLLELISATGCHAPRYGTRFHVGKIHISATNGFGSLALGAYISSLIRGVFFLELFTCHIKKLAINDAYFVVFTTALTRSRRDMVTAWLDDIHTKSDAANLITEALFKSA